MAASRQNIQKIVDTLTALSKAIVIYPDGTDTITSYIELVPSDDMKSFTNPYTFTYTSETKHNLSYRNPIVREYPSALHYLTDIYPFTAERILLRLKKLETPQIKDEKQPQPAPKPLDALPSKANLIRLITEHHAQRDGLLTMTLGLISKTYDEAIIKSDKTLLIDAASPFKKTSLATLSTFQARLSPEIYTSVALEKCKWSDLTLTQAIAKTNNVPLWRTHVVEKLHRDILIKDAECISKNGDTTLGFVAKYLGEELTAYQNALPKKTLNDAAKQFTRLYDGENWCPVTLSANNSNYDTFISFINKLSPFTLQATSVSRPNVLDAIRLNRTMTDVQKTNAKAHYSRLLNFEIELKFEELVAFASLHLKNTPIVDAKEWISALEKAIPRTNDSKIKNQLRALLGRAYLSLHSIDHDQTTMAKAYETFLLIDNPNDLDAPDSLLVSNRLLPQDSSNLSKIPDFMSAPLTALGINIYDAQTLGLKHFEAASKLIKEAKKSDAKETEVLSALSKRVASLNHGDQKGDEKVINKQIEDELQEKAIKLHFFGRGQFEPAKKQKHPVIIDANQLKKDSKDAKTIIDEVCATLSRVISTQKTYAQEDNTSPFWKSAVGRHNIATKLQKDMEQCYKVIKEPRCIEDKVFAIDKLRNQYNYHLAAYKPFEKRGSHLDAVFNALSKDSKGNGFDLTTKVSDLFTIVNRIKKPSNSR